MGVGLQRPVLDRVGIVGGSWDSVGLSKLRRSGRCGHHDGHMAVTDETIAQCVDHFRGLLDDRPGTPESLARVTRSGLMQIVQRAGAKRRSGPLLARLDDAFAERGIVTFPSLTNPKNKPDERIYLFDRDHQIEDLVVNRQTFGNQTALREFIRTNLHEFEELRGLADIEDEFPFPSGRKIDLLATRPRRNQLVGIELKLGEAKDGAVGQCQHYIDDLKIAAVSRGMDAHFVLISGGNPNRSVRTRIESYARTRTVTVDLLLHSVEMRLRTYR